MLIFIDYFEVSNYGSGNSGTGSPPTMQANIGGSSMVLFLPTTVTSLAVGGIKWMIILIFYINLSKAKAYSLLAFCTAIVGNIIEYYLR